MVEADQLQLKILPVFLVDGFQNHPGEEGLDRRHSGKAAHNQRRQLGNQADPHILHQHRNKKRQSQRHQSRGTGTEECVGPVNAEESADGPQNPCPVRKGVEFGYAALQAIPVNDAVTQEIRMVALSLT